MTDPITPDGGGWQPAVPEAPAWSTPGQADLTGPTPGWVPSAPFQDAAEDRWTPAPFAGGPPPADDEPAVVAAVPYRAPPLFPQVSAPAPPTQPTPTATPRAGAVSAPATSASNPISSGRSGYPGRSSRRRATGNNGLISIVAGAVSILIVLVSLPANGNGRPTFLLVIPVFGLLYGLAGVVRRQHRVLGIVGMALCAVALVVQGILTFG